MTLWDNILSTTGHNPYRKILGTPLPFAAERAGEYARGSSRVGPSDPRADEAKLVIIIRCPHR